jgi:hypothetical protein
MELPGALMIHDGKGTETGILVDVQGITEIGPMDASGFRCEERVDRELAFGVAPHFRLLLHGTMLEFYLNDILIQCYTMARVPDGTMSCRNVAGLRAWQWE